MRIVRLNYRTAEKLEGAKEWEAELNELYNNDVGKFAPNKTAYRIMDEQGILRCAELVTDDNELAGAVILLVSRSTHLKVPYVVVDVLYLRKKYRRGRWGVKLMEEAEQMAREEGATGLGLNTIPGSTYDKLCAARGYLLARNTYWRPI